MKEVKENKQPETKQGDVIEYRLIADMPQGSLERKVNAAIKEGMELYGDPVFYLNQLVQPMVRRKR